MGRIRLVRIVVGGLLGGTVSAGELRSQVSIMPDTVVVQIGERMAGHRFYVDFSGLTPNAQSVRLTVPSGMEIEAMGESRDSTRTCGVARRGDDSATSSQYVEWRKPAWVTGQWLGFPKCLLALRLTDVHGRTAMFPVRVTHVDGRVTEDPGARLMIIGPSRSTWWVAVLGGIVLVGVVVVVVRRPGRRT